MGYFINRLACKLYDLGVGTEKMGKSIFRFVGENYDVLMRIMSGKELSVVEFLRLYDQRIYNVHSKQNDIKYMKDLDFKGIYCIKNVTKKKFYVGHADRVFKKVERYFRGFENASIYADYENNNYFTVQFFYLESNGYNNINELLEDTEYSGSR